MKKLLLLHGAIGAESQFAALKTYLPEFELYSFNFSGHGGKSFSNSFSIEGFADELKEYVIMNNLQGIDVFGYSMGGYVALYLTTKHPNLINSIFTLGTMLNFDRIIIHNVTNKLDPDLIISKVPKFAEILKKRHHPNEWKELLFKTNIMMNNLSQNIPISENSFKSLENKIMFAIGDRDDTADVLSTINTFRIVRNSQLLIIPNCQHPIEKIDKERLSYEISIFFK